MVHLSFIRICYSDFLVAIILITEASSGTETNQSGPLLMIFEYHWSIFSQVHTYSNLRYEDLLTNRKVQVKKLVTLALGVAP